MFEYHHSHNPHSGTSEPGSDTIARDTRGQVFHYDLMPLLERLTTAFLALDHSWRITYLSDQSDPLLEQTRATLLGKTLWEVFPQAVASPLYRKYSAAVAVRSLVHFEEFYPPLNKWFEIHVSPSNERVSVFVQDITSRKRPVKDVGGTIIGTSTIAQDISEQAVQSETGLRRLAHSNIIGIVFWNLDGDITWANDYFLKMVGYTQEELLAGNVRWKDMTPGEYAHVDARAIEELKAHRALAAPFEKEYIRKDGSRVPILLGSALLDTSQHEGVSFILDVSERKELRQKDEFINMASHELRTPLTCMLGYTDLLRLLLEGEGSQQAIQYVSKMEVQLEKLHRLIADLLDISKAQAGKLVYAEELVAMNELVREVVEEVQLTTPRHCIVIEAETTCEVVGDRDRLGQVVVNLLSNAIKYSPQAEKVCVRMACTAGEIIVSVQDFGIGIPSDSQERVFERFYRGSIRVEQRFPGLGIGLYIAHQIVSHHGGRFWVESTEGQGSTFSFALPLKQGGLPLENEQVMKQRSILVVDDEPAILDIVQTILTRERYRVQTSSDGACLHSLESDPPDLILLDVLLKGEDGRELCRELKEREQTRHIPVILFSAHVAANGAPESCGADDFLSKPFRIKELLAIVARWIGSEQNG